MEHLHKKKKRRKKNNTGLFVGIVLGLVVLVGGGVAIVLAVTGKKDEPVAKAPPAKAQPAPPRFEPKPRKGGKDLISAVARRLEISEVNNAFRQLGLSYQNVASASTSGRGPADFKELTELHGTTPLKEWLDKNWIIVVWGARPLSQAGGASNTALAWETDADLQGNRVVLMCSGSIVTMDEATFANTAKAMGR
jgi:hypothetical protein